MSGWSRKDVINFIVVTILGIVTIIVTIIVGVAPQEVRCLVGIDFCSNSQLISKSTEVDYNPLRKLLVEGKWKDADRETANAMLQAAGREEEGWLKTEDLDNFSCEDLRIIDQLWLESSQGKFGFSVQKEIYEELGGTREYNQEVWESFGDRIGWRKEGNWLYYDEHTFNLNAPQAHLPRMWDRRRIFSGSVIFICNLNAPIAHLPLWGLVYRRDMLILTFLFGLILVATDSLINSRVIMLKFLGYGGQLVLWIYSVMFMVDVFGFWFLGGGVCLWFVCVLLFLCLNMAFD